jgi:hypothetical protein
MGQPVWNTAPGSIGTFGSGVSLLYQLSASPAAPATSLTYTIVSGNLPAGLGLNLSGTIFGSTTLISSNSFTVQALDNLGNAQNRTFSIDVVPSQPNWITPAGTIGAFPSGSPLEFQFSATAIQPAVYVQYTLLSSSLPAGLSLTTAGLLHGTSEQVYTNTQYTFVIRATDNNGNITDRTFSMVSGGINAPSFVTPAGIVLNTNDSIWVQLPIKYSLPISDSTAIIELVQGVLPPGLEINEFGLIRGYANPPVVSVSLGLVTDAAIAIIDNTIVCYSTSGFTVGRPVVFSGTVFGGVTAGATYYIKSVSTDGVSFTISTTVGGPTYELTDDVGYMLVTLPNVTVGQPTIRTYEFTLKLSSVFGSALRSYAITVVNQNALNSLGGPGYPPNSRIPTIFNTRPSTYNIRADVLDYRFYILPPDSKGITYLPSQFAYIGKITSDNVFNFQILGHDFDGSELEYVFADLPLGLTGNSVTGWVTGNPIISDNSISQFNFSVAVRKKSSPGITSPSFNFSFRIRNGISGDIVWLTPNNIGTVFNGTTSVLKIEALSDIDLSYSLQSGTLPPNLTLLPSGELSGVIAFQPSDTVVLPGETTSFTFTIRAYSSTFSSIYSDQTFTIDVYQLFQYPTDTLYIKCSPSLENRALLQTLLTDDTLIPPEYLYRGDDPYFGKATNVIYEHAYGIYASDFEDYVAAITKNHYWRNITLGELKTAIARDETTGEIIYEVVYSSVIDNLINPDGVSVSKKVVWPRYIPLELGPWYTSETDLFASYVSAPDGQGFYTSLTPGYVQNLYPNSLPNMRTQVIDVLGQEQNTNLLPLWMTSQQVNGSTLGFIPAWVICYTKPGYAEIVKNNIETKWKNSAEQVQTLNQINFTIDRFTVNKSTTYDYDNNLYPPTWTTLPSGSPVPNPLDSKDFFVLFPHKTILPIEPEYKK